MHTNSKLLFQKYAIEHFRPGCRVLEIGPNKIPSDYQQLVGSQCAAWDTLDMTDNPGLTYRTQSEYSFPIADSAYDVVVSGQVLEHVRKIWTWMREVARVCKPGGVVITVSPVSWPYHEAPHDCWRVYPEGMRALYEEASLDVLMSNWESLEAPQFSRHIPGRSWEWQPRGWRTANRLLGHFGLPVESAFDTITIGRKPDPSRPVTP